MAAADLAGPLVAAPIAAVVAGDALAGAGVLTGVATVIATATGCTVLAAAALAAAAAAASVAVESVAVALLSLLSLPSPFLLSVDDGFAGAAGAADAIWVGSAGGGTPSAVGGFAWGSELVEPLAALVFVVAVFAA